MHSKSRMSRPPSQLPLPRGNALIFTPAASANWIPPFMVMMMIMVMVMISGLPRTQLGGGVAGLAVPSCIHSWLRWEPAGSSLPTSLYHHLHTMCYANCLYLCLKSSHLLNAHKPLPLVVILPPIIFVIANISTNSQYK